MTNTTRPACNIEWDEHEGLEWNGETTTVGAAPGWEIELWSCTCGDRTIMGRPRKIS